MDLLDFALSKMDVRSERSHLTGKMTFTIGTDTLIVKDVQLAASPVNFDLLRTLNGKPFPYNWQGDITGTVQAAGGNLARFKVDDAALTFADANVPGAITRATGHGEINIFDPAFTAFNEFYVNIGTLDLRTLQFLNKNFPRLNGTVAGTAVLDSSWLDIRFHDAQLTHSDGPGPQSVATGSGRVTWGDLYLTYDLNLQMQPLAFETLRRSYPAIPLHASMSGPLVVKGQSPNLDVQTTLSGAGGTLSYAGQIDADPPSYGVRGTGSVTGADLRTLLANSSLPHTEMNGSYAVDLAGDSLGDASGSASLTLAQSNVANEVIQPSYAAVHFGGGVVTIDTMSVAADGARATASGTVALTDQHAGALAYHLTIASVPELAGLLGVTAPDVKATLRADGTVTGTPDALATTGSVTAGSITAGPLAAAALSGRYALSDLGGKPSGTATASLDTVAVGPVTVRSASVALRIANPNEAVVQRERSRRRRRVRRRSPATRSAAWTGASPSRSTR